MKDCFNSYPLDRVCQEVCTAAILSGEYYANATRKVVSERARLTRELRNLGFFVPDSGSNFLFAGNKNTGGEYIYKELKARGVLVRYWNKPRLSDFCRITVGSREQNDALLSALREILK
jgi:histidinol-phosphate aminotransferase